MRCPICKKQFDSTDPATRSPFCSERCKLIDLGRWLDGAYQIPVATPDADSLVDSLSEELHDDDTDADD